MLNDLRYAFRMLLKSPGFTAVAVLTLAVGIGANTAIFTVINAVLLRSLPVTNPHELVQVQLTGRSRINSVFSYPLYQQLREGQNSLSGLFAAGGVGLKDRLIVPRGGSTEIEFVRAQPVSSNFFSVLGVPEMLGQAFATGEPQAALVLSHGFWQRRFGGDASVIGQAVTFNDLPFTIAGVMPPDFFGFQPGEVPELWWPLELVPQVDADPAGGRLKEGQHWLRLMGRLSPAAARLQSEAELGVTYQRYREEYAVSRAPRWSESQRQEFFAQKLELRSGHAGGWTGLRHQTWQPVLILMAAVAAVLLIVCANVASLQIARNAAREREFSVRSALGAGRLRLIRQLLAESLLLAALGGVLGLLLAQGGTRLLQGVMRLPNDPISLSLAPDLRILLFTAAAALLTGVLFGLAPALRSSRVELASTLKGSASGIAGSGPRRRLHQSLVVAQVALSLVLLIGAGLFVRTLNNLVGLDSGFNRENLIVFNIDFSDRPDMARWTSLYKGILERLRSTPGVRAASLFSQGYLSGNGWSDNMSVDGAVSPVECAGTRVGPSFFETFGTPVLAGREFGTQDERPAGPAGTAAPGTAVINQAMARHFFGDASPLGRHFFLTHRPDIKWEIVGVVPNAKYGSLREPSQPMFYVPFFQDPSQSFVNFALRTDGDPKAMLANVAGIVRDVDRTVRVRDVRTMREVVNRAVQQERLIAQLGGFFSIVSVALACLGLYGVLSFAVVQRTREIGVRVALGAGKTDILSMVVRQGLMLVVIGCVLGILISIAITRLVSSLLFGVSSTDPALYATVTGIFFLIALLSSWLPARRASRIDPMVALRSE